MNALIFAAGLGTRLNHITKNKPKALVQVGGKPMLQHAIEKLIDVGADNIVINIHHHAKSIKDFVFSLNYAHTTLHISDESEELLETGGGLLKAANLFDNNKPIILYNSDVLTGANLSKMIDYHHHKKSIATLMVKERSTSRYFLFDDDMRLSGWENISTKEQRITREKVSTTSLAFSGIHIIQPELIKYLGEIRKFSITEGYLNISSIHKIYGWKDWDDYWFDIGTPEKLQIANNYFEKRTKSSIR